MVRGIYTFSVVAFLLMVGVALAGGAPDQSVSSSCHGKSAAKAAAPSCQGEAADDGGSCHGSKATRRTMAQRRADRQSGRQEARADRAEARSASKGCHGAAAKPVAACSCGDCEACQ
jgi:hypothetical protein